MKEGGEGREKERVLGKREREALPIKSKSKMAIYLPVGIQGVQLFNLYLPHRK